MLLLIILTCFMLATGRVPGLISFPTVQWLGVLCLVLQACEFYRQRFYLDWESEWGVHWRVLLVQYAKWPWLLMALFDFCLGRRVGYVLTPKVNSESVHHLLILPNTLVIILIFGAWIIGHGLGFMIHPLVYAFAASFVLASFFLIWTQFWDAPPPYQKRLLSNIE